MDLTEGGCAVRQVRYVVVFLNDILICCVKSYVTRNPCQHQTVYILVLDAVVFRREDTLAILMKKEKAHSRALKSHMSRR